MDNSFSGVTCGWRRLLLCGICDLAEIATVRVNDHATLDIIGFCDTDSERHQFLGRPVWHSPTEANAHDAWVLADFTRSAYLV